MEPERPASHKPLSGIRILDLSTMLAGPFGSMMLADLGADVIKIETPDGDGTRTFPPHFHKGDSLYYISVNRNKKSIVIDLKQPDGLTLFYELVKKSDVVWDNFRSGIGKRLKVDYDTLKQINPEIISCSISAFGEGNPHDGDQPIYDLCIQGMSGVLDMTGEASRPPVKLGIPMADLSGGWYAVVGLLAALVERSRTGKGQKVDVAMLDSIASLHTYEAAYCLFSGSVPHRIGTNHRSLVPYQIFQTKDIYIAIVVALDKFWVNLCNALKIPQYGNDERFATIAARYEHRQDVVDLLSRILIEKTCDEWLLPLKAAGVPCAPVNTLDKALKEPALLHRNMVVDIDHYGEPVKVLGNPVKMSNNDDTFTRPPKLGESTCEVLKDVLGYSESEIERLACKKVINRGC
jgi:crotonobetainyl-CoA:carnitine CoA-transferase CaiB-like acyl-CoA transferase